MGRLQSGEPIIHFFFMNDIRRGNYIEPPIWSLPINILMQKKSQSRNPHFILVNRTVDLTRMCDILRKEQEIGVDLEADSMFHYKEKICLIQVAGAENTYLVDPLALDNLSPLIDIISDNTIDKVFHGGDYDVRSLYRDYSAEVHNLFDTHIAAKFLGRKETGLGAILANEFGVAVKKSNQKKDWSIRPLPAAMLKYAASDASYLLPLARRYKEELSSKGRLDWVLEECEILSRVRPSSNKRAPLFLGFKGAAQLDGASLALLENILEWREHLARKRDLPPFKILGNVQILSIVRKKPKSLEDLRAIEHFGHRQVHAFGRTLLKKIEESHIIPEKSWPCYPRKQKRRASTAVSLNIQKLRDWRTRASGIFDIEPSLLCSNKLIQSLALSRPKSMNALFNVEGIRRWQVRLYGDEICYLIT